MNKTSHPTGTAALSPGRSVGGYLTRRRAVWFIMSLVGMLVGIGWFSLISGSEVISPGRIGAAILAALTGGEIRLTPEQATILFRLRMPRIALAIGVGASLSLAGASFQTLLRNPLADPYVMGISGGAATGTIVAILFAPALPVWQPICGFVGAMAAMAAVYRLGRREEDPAYLALAGVVISTLLSSVIVLLTSTADDIRLRNIMLWLMGDLSGGTPLEGSVTIIAAILATGVLFPLSRALNLMMIGERDAFALGVETVRVRWTVYLIGSLLTAVSVMAGGAIGYVGLVVPHLIRLGGGSDNRLVIPASAIGGAVLVLAADTLARTVIAPRELPTGAITAMIGAPVFLFLLIRGRR